MQTAHFKHTVLVCSSWQEVLLRHATRNTTLPSCLRAVGKAGRRPAAMALARKGRTIQSQLMMRICSPPIQSALTSQFRDMPGKCPQSESQRPQAPTSQEPTGSKVPLRRPRASSPRTSRAVTGKAAFRALAFTEEPLSWLPVCLWSFISGIYQKFLQRRTEEPTRSKGCFQREEVRLQECFQSRELEAC